jgi:hypothetical protein
LIQHEIDHLDGVLFIDRVVSPTYIVAREHRTGAAATHGKALLAATHQPGQAPVIVSL